MGWKHLTEKDYEMIKTLLDAGIKKSKISDITGRGDGTVYNIAASSSFIDYKNISRSSAKKKAPTVSDETTAGAPPIIQDDAQMLIVEELRNINKILIRLCVAWETTPTKSKKGWL